MKLELLIKLLYSFTTNLALVNRELDVNIQVQYLELQHIGTSTYEIVNVLLICVWSKYNL